MVDPQSGRFYLNLYCWDVFFASLGNHSLGHLLIPTLQWPLNSVPHYSCNSKVNTFLGCPIGSPQTSFQFRFAHHWADSLVSQSGHLYSRFHKGEFVLSRKVSSSNLGSVVKLRWALCPLSCPSPPTGPCRTNPEGICSFLVLHENQHQNHPPCVSLLEMLLKYILKYKITQMSVGLAFPAQYSEFHLLTS